MLILDCRESPRWLLEQGRVDQARHSMRWLRPDDETADAELHEIQLSMEQEKEMKDGLALSDLWKNPIDRRRTIAAVAAVNTQAASGAIFIIGKLPRRPTR